MRLRFDIYVSGNFFQFKDCVEGMGGVPATLMILSAPLTILRRAYIYYVILNYIVSYYIILYQSYGSLYVSERRGSWRGGWLTG